MNSVKRRLKTAVVSGWSFIVIVLLIAWVLSSLFPQWFVYVTQVASAHSLFVGILILALFYLALWKLPQRYVSTVPCEKDRIDLEWKAHQTMAQLIGGALLLSGLFFTAKTLQLSQQTLQTSQEGQITDRFGKAVAQLGDDKLIVRLGGIYSLGRIAKDSVEKDSQTVIDVLTAFVREHAPLKKQRAPGPPEPDIQAILTVITKRTPGQQWDINLRHTDLQEAELWSPEFLRADLRGANLRAVKFFGALFRGVNFGGANLAGADLTMASLYGSDFEGATLEGANLRAARLDTPDFKDSPADSAFKKLFPHLFSPEMEQRIADLRNANLGKTDLRGANLKRADLRNAELQEVINLTQEQVSEACVDQNTKLPPRLKKPQPCRGLPN
jgi:hypothetical protein